MNQYVFDFEFVEGNPCLPISLGICTVEENHLRTGYWEWPEAYERASASDWLMANVRPHLKMKESPIPKVDAIMPWNKDQQLLRRNLYIAHSETLIAKEVRDWLGNGDYELIADCGAYDFFLLSQLMGGFQRCPKNFPYTYRDAAHMGLPKVEPVGDEHNALSDTLTIRAAILSARRTT